MYKRKFIPLVLLMILIVNGCSNKQEVVLTPVDYVNPYMGNISHLLVPTYPTVHLPNSMLRIYPERADYTSDKIKGLPVIVTSHRGKSAFSLSFYQGAESGLQPVYYYCYDNEVIKPYSYSSYFEEEEVSTKFAPSHQAGIYELSFRKNNAPYDVENQMNIAKNIWNQTLNKIKVEGIDENAKAIFYTSLYRTYERMICLSEDNRYYSAFDNSIHKDSVPFYTDDWIWDTYRAVHPLRVIIEPQMEADMIQSFIRMAQQMEHNWMPTFPEVTGDSRRMNSNHGVATVIDSYIKGIRNFDLSAAYEACKLGITEKTLAPWSGIKGGEITKFYWENGYLPALAPGEQETADEVHPFEKRQPVAVTLGTSYDEWCLAQIAKQLGYEKDYNYFLQGSKNYRNIFNPETKFFHPKNAKGEFIEPFDYATAGGLGAREAYGENNGWIYRWDVPHNIADLIELMGGKEAFRNNLETMYNTPLGEAKYVFYAQLPDHTGNVGQFSMANEPSMHIPYLYNYIGEPWRTQKRVRTLLDEWFRNDLMGLPGDEDGGGMSAFVVFSMLGFYPITPGLPIYVIGTPMFERAVIETGAGKSFEVIAHNYSPTNKYIQSAKLNGKDWNQSWFEHKELMNGGKLEFTMGNTPNKNWAADSVPPSFEMNK